jgi:flavin-dependent dehydrogenase
MTLTDSVTLHADVVVVGARCAGAATAMLLARAGHDVLVVDRAQFPSDTISTHSIARPGVVQLGRWGLLQCIVDSGAPRCRRVDLYSPSGGVTRRIKERYGTDFLVNPRRVVLDAFLQEAAVEAGARVLAECSAEGLLKDGRGRVVGLQVRNPDRHVEVRARHVVGADGLGSRVARWAGAPFSDVRATTGATLYTYVPGDWSALEYHVADGGFAGVFPTHGGEACVWVCSPQATAKWHRRLHPADRGLLSLLSQVAPSLADRVRDAGRRSPTRGMLSMPNHRRVPSGSGWALVGDASIHRDAITGFGISDAFRDAELLAAALDTALRSPADEVVALRDYERERDRISTRVFDLTLQLAAFPEPTRFTQLQKELAVAIDEQAGELAGRPLPYAAALPASA